MKQSHPQAIKTYLLKRAVTTPWQINGNPAAPFDAAVVIPALAETDNLRLTLASLAANPAEQLAKTLILIVVNNRLDATPKTKADNRNTLEQLPLWREELQLSNLHWVDAATGNLELPAGQGVGLARKIGMDLALRQLDYQVDRPLLICLDADTLVAPDYLPAIRSHFNASSAGGASIAYRHQTAGERQQQEAIDRYELFLRSYQFGLKQAGSPYAFATIGSAMACTAAAYAASGGMNRRQAGEDFYFLQQVYKTSGVETLNGTTVFPSPRASDRVPFGTGRAVGDMLNAGNGQLLFYDPRLFDLLAQWLECAMKYSCEDGENLLKRGAAIADGLGLFLQQTGFAAAWDGILKNCRDQDRLATAFHGWFDAFRTMRFMHQMTDSGYPRQAPEQAVAVLLGQCGLSARPTVSEMLEYLRTVQG